jgi:hypothetical protein
MEPGPAALLPLKAAYGIQKDQYDSLVGSTYNELSMMTNDQGESMNIDHQTKAALSRGVGVVGSAMSGVVGFALMKTAPFLSKFVNPALAREIVSNPSMAAVKATLLNIGTAAGTGAAGSGATEMARILAEEMGRTYDGSEASFMNGLESAAARWKENSKRVGEAAVVGGLTSGVIATGTGVAGFKSTKDRFQGMSEQVNTMRAGLARDVTPVAPKELPAAGKPNPDVPMDVGPVLPSAPQQSVKVLQLRTAMENMGKVAQQTKVAKLAPEELSSFKQMVFSNAGLKRVWLSAEDVQKYLTDPKRGERARNLIDPSGVAAEMMNSPVKIEPHKFMELVQEFPEAYDAMKIEPDGPTPIQAEKYLESLEKAEGQRQDVLKKLGAKEITEEQAAALEQANNTQLLDETVPENVEWLPTATTAEHQYMTEPTFTKAIEGILPEAEVKKFNAAQMEARGHVLNAIKEAAQLELLQVQDIETEYALQAQREQLNLETQNNPNYQIIDKFSRDVVANAKGKKPVSLYAMDPELLTPDQVLRYADKPAFIMHNAFVKGGVSPDEAARLMGVESGEELLRVMSITRPRKDVIELQLNELYKEDIEAQVKASVPLNEAMIIKAITNVTKNHLMEMKFMREQKWPATKAGFMRIALPLPRIEELTFKAREAVKVMRVGDLNVNQFKVGERKSQRIAVKSILKNEVLKAYKAKEAAALNSEFQKETMKAIGRVNRVFRYARKFDEPTFRTELKDAGKVYVDAANEILDVFNLNPSRKNTAQQGAYRKFVEGRVKAGDGDFTIPDRLAEVRANADELTVEQTELIGDRLRAIHHMAKLKNRLLNKFREQEAIQTEEAIVSYLNEGITEHPQYDPGRIPPTQDTKTTHQRARAAMQSALSLFKNSEHIVRTMDQGKLGGRWHELIIHPIKGDGKYNRLMGYSGELQDIKVFKQHFEKNVQIYGKKDFDKIESTILDIPEFKGISELNDGRLTKGDLMVMWAYGGDPYTYQKRATNFKVSNEIIQAVLDRELELRDVVFMQNMYINGFKSYRDRTQALQKQTTGQDVTFVEGKPNVWNGKEFPGGYVPAKYRVDYTNEAIKANLQALERKKAAVFGGTEGEYYARQHAAEMTEQGRLIERTDSGNPLDLSFIRAMRSYEEIIHDLNYRIPVRDTLKVLRNPEIKQSMLAVVGEKDYQLVVNSIIEQANRIEAENANYFGDQQRYFKQVYGYFKGAFSISVLGANMTSVGIQYVSLAQVAQNLGLNGSMHLAGALKSISSHPHEWKGFYDFAKELDPTIEKVVENVQDKLVSNVYELMPKKADKFAKLKPIARAQKIIVDASMYTMGLADVQLKMASAMAGYRQFMAGDAPDYPIERLAGMSSEEKNAAATAYVRQLSRLSLTHSTDFDKAPIQKIPGADLFAMYWNDLRNGLNNQMNQGRKIKWSMNDSYEEFKEGNYAGMRSNAKGAAAAFIGMAMVATIHKIYEDMLRGKGTPVAYLKDVDWTKPEQVLDASQYMTSYMLQATPEVFSESVPFLRDIKYAGDRETRSSRKEVQVPMMKVMSDMATTYATLNDTLDMTKMDSQQLKAFMFTMSYLTGGLPVNGAYKFSKWLEDKDKPMEVVTSAIEETRDKIAGYLKDPPPDVSDSFLKDLEELEKQLTPENAAMDPQALDAIKYAESGNNWQKLNPANGAAGIYQFTPQRWLEIMTGAPELGLTENGRVSKDPTQQELAMDWQSQRNAEQLISNGLKPDDANIYGSHLLGIDNYLKVAKAPRDAKLKVVVGQEVVKSTPQISEFKTVGQVKDYLNRQLVEGRKSLTLSVTTTED